MVKIRVLVVDDHTMLRRGLTSSLSIEPDIAVVGEAANGEEAIAQFRALQPDLVILDWQMPRMTGPEVVGALRTESAAARVLILSAFDGDDHIYHASKSGALGYILKSAERVELLAAVRAVA